MGAFTHVTGDIIRMIESTHIPVLEGMSLDNLKVLRKEANRRIKNEKARLKFKANVEIPAEYREHFETAVRWAQGRNLIKTGTRWAFCKFAITNTIDFIIGEIQKEELAKAQAAAQISAGIVSEPQNYARHTPDTTKTA